MKSSIWGLGAVLVLLLAAAPAVNIAYAGAGVSQPIEDEPMSVEYGAPVPVETNATAYGADVTITRNGSTLSPGTDYRWHAANGTIDFLNTSATSAGDTVLVDYDARQRSSSTEQFATLFALGGRVAGFLVLALGVGLALQGVRGGP